MFQQAVTGHLTHIDAHMDDPKMHESIYSLLRALKTMLGLGGRITVAHDLPELSLYGVNEYGVNYGVVHDPSNNTWSVNS